MVNKTQIAARAITALIAIAAIGGGTAYAGSSAARNKLLDETEAETFAILDAGVEEEEVTGLRTVRKKSDGQEIYEIIFYAGGYQYEYDIHAENGTILDMEMEAVPKKGQTAENKTPEQQGQTAENETPEQGKMAANETPEQEHTAENETPEQQDAVTQPETRTGESKSAYITVDQAKKIALDHAGLSEQEVRFTSSKFEDDKEEKEFEIEFYVGNVEYEYDIDAVTGRILDFSKEVDDD